MQFRIEEQLNTKDVFGLSKGGEFWELFCLGEQLTCLRGVPTWEGHQGQEKTIMDRTIYNVI